MTNRIKLFLSIMVLIFISNLSFSQSKEIKVRFIGNAGLHMTDGDLNIYVDFPYKSGAYGYMKYEESILDSIKDNSIFIFTHRHADHYSKKLLIKIKKKHNVKVYGNWNVKKMDKLNSSTKDFSIQSFKTKHKFTFKHYSYLITWHGKKIFLSGDTTNPETLGNIKEIDWAFISPWILTYAKEQNINIDTKMKVLYHIYPNEKIVGEIPDDMIILKKQNKIISIPIN